MAVHARILKSGEVPEAVSTLDAITGRARVLSRRRLAWLDHLAEAASVEGAGRRLPADLTVALLNLDSPEAEASFYAGDPDARELTARAGRFQDAISADADGSLAHLIEVLGASESEVELLQICLASELDPSIAKIYGYLEGDAGRRAYPTEALAARLCGYGRIGMWSPAGALARWQVIDAGPSDPGEPPALRVDPFIVRFLQGHREIDPELLNCAGYIDPRDPQPGWPVEEVAERIAQALGSGLANRVFLVGQRLSGRRTFSACVADRLGSILIGVDTGRVAPSDWERVHTRVRRQALLHCCAIAWYGPDVPRGCAPTATRIPLEFGILEPPGEVTTEPGWREERVELPRLLSGERRLLWESLLPSFGSWDEQSRNRLSERYPLQIGEISYVSAQSPSSFDEVRTLAREFSRGRLDDLGQMLDCPFQLEDLQVPERLAGLIGEFLFEARGRIRFWENERIRRLFPRGTGLIGLMAGPPGTGKTMAAQVIAAELELDLYRIDMASTVNKYIGETSKNLRRLFARAADMNAVLLFDEADALFSKRTEVRDSHDRYANADTNYLLQLIEDYPGIALLATNKRQNMDEAFVRRVRYLMFFPRPDATQRLAIWQQMVREMAGSECEQQLAKHLEQVAARVEATGAQIKNATLAAMFLARQAGSSLEVEHLRRGLERELLNQGRTASVDPQPRKERR